MRSIIGLVVGVVLLWYGASWQSASEPPAQQLRTQGVKVVGEVVGVQEVQRTRRVGGRRDLRTEDYLARCPEIAFEAEGGRRTFVERADCDRLDVGDRVTVMYDPQRAWAPRLDSAAVVEEEARVDRTRWLLVGVGSMLVLGCGAALFRRLNRFVAGWSS